MKKVIAALLVVASLVIIGMIVLAFTKPDRQEHTQVIKKEVVSAVSRELGDDPMLEELAVLGTVTAMNAVEKYMGQVLVVRDYTVCSVGVIVYNGNVYPITIGAFNHVWLLADKEDVKRALENTEFFKQLREQMGVKDLDDVKRLLESFGF